ncbi:MAG: HAD-IIIC family phosphatase [Planctomycetota bacterium]|jgi:FkbH-like protein
MTETALRWVSISDFNLDNFNAYLTNDEEWPRVQVLPAPFGQVQALLMDGSSECWRESPEFALVWTQPHRVIDSFRRALALESVDHGAVLEEVDEFADTLLAIEDRVRAVFVPCWTLPPHHRGLGLLDLRTDLGIGNLLMRMNLRLAERLDGHPGYHVLDARRWVESSSREAFNPKLWYMAKIAFGNDVFREAVKDCKAALRAVSGKAKKLVIVDLDDTLWGGIVGDLGWENITLGGLDHVGEAFRDFQHGLKALTNRGILLAIVSKNEESVALEAISKHPEMVLRIDDFAGWRINWNDKAMNIADLVDELNLGLDAAVFIDDNPAERGRVREALPEVLVPEWPEDRTHYLKTLVGLRCFDTASLSPEDRERAKMYTTERRRKEARKGIGSVEDWLASLGVTVGVEVLNEANLPRAAQMMNKTNQMNLATRRMTEAELKEWAEADGRRVWTFRVEDRFGDLGVSGLISFEPDGDEGRIVDFLLSCRVFGRQVEETMVAVLMDHARSLGLSVVRAQFTPTKKNKPCLDFWRERSGFVAEDEDEHALSRGANEEYPVPSHVTLEGFSPAGSAPAAS